MSSLDPSNYIVSFENIEVIIECKECRKKNLWFSVKGESQETYFHYCHLKPTNVKWILDHNQLQLEEEKL